MLQSDIVEATKSTSRDELFEALYNIAFPTIARYIKKRNGSLDDAKDLFQDALVIYFEKVDDPSNLLKNNVEAYLMGIVKHLWARRVRALSHTTLIIDESTFEALPDDVPPTINQIKLLKYLAVAGKKCMDLLRFFYFEKLPLDVITQNNGFSSVHSASVQKYKCLEKIRNTVKHKSQHYEDFFE